MSLIRLLWKGFGTIIVIGIIWEMFGGFIKLILDVAFACGVIYIGYNFYKLYKKNH